ASCSRRPPSSGLPIKRWTQQSVPGSSSSTARASSSGIRWSDPRSARPRRQASAEPRTAHSRRAFRSGPALGAEQKRRTASSRLTLRLARGIELPDDEMAMQMSAQQLHADAEKMRAEFLERVSHVSLEPNPALAEHAKQRAGSVQNRIADQITAFA